MSSVMKSPHAIIETKVENMWLGAVLVLKYCHSLGRNYFCNRIIRVPEICQASRSKSAAFYASRHHALGDSVVAEITFVGDFVFRVEEADTVRTCHDAIAATDAPFPVNQHDTVFGLVGRTYRTNLDTGRVVTLITKLGYEKRLGDTVRINFFIANFVAGEAIPAAIRRVDVNRAILGDDVTFNPCPGYR